MWLRASVVLLALCTSAVFFAQTHVPVAPPQTAREALVEMLTGGEKGLTRHLTVEAKEFLSKPESKLGADFSVMIHGLQSQTSSGMQTFSTGSTLLVVNEPTQHKKLEVHVDNDDLNGDQDVLQLSLHSFSDDQEEHDEFGYMSSHITVTLKKQQNIWRLSNVGVGMEFPLGDPEFLKKAFFNVRGDKAANVGLSAVAGATSSDVKPEKAAAFDPGGVVTMLGWAERSYATQHPDIGFTCSLSELAEFGKAFGLDPQLSSGTYNGYKWSISGCDNKPAGSFQIIAEPITQGINAKVACIDATGNLRVLEDGRGGACFTSGKVNTQANDDEFIGLDTHVHIDSDKSKP